MKYSTDMINTFNKALANTPNSTSLTKRLLIYADMAELPTSLEEKDTFYSKVSNFYNENGYFEDPMLFGLPDDNDPKMELYVRTLTIGDELLDMVRHYNFSAEPESEDDLADFKEEFDNRENRIIYTISIPANNKGGLNNA